MASIKQDMVHSVFWSAIEKYSGLVVSIIVSMILARILSPQEYGVVAIATVLIQFLQMFCTMGIGPAIIQRKDLTDKDLDSIFTFSLLIGVALSVLFFVGSWGIASFYDDRQLIPVCQILSIQVFFAAANMVPSALMAKNKRFKDIARRTLTLQIISGIISVIAAYNGAGVYALLVSPVFTAIGIFIWNRRFYKVSINTHMSLDPIKRILPFSAYQFMFDFINYFSRNLDKLIIGRYMTVSELGFYEKSYRLMQLPLNNLTSVINPVLQPVLASLQDQKQEMANKYNKLIQYMASISFPLGAILYMCGSEIIHFFYGGNWDGAIDTFKILSLSVPLQLILSTTGGIFQACNETKQLFYAGLRNTAVTVTGFIIAAVFFGTKEAIAWGWTLTSYLCFLSSFGALYYIVFKTSIFDMLRKLIHPLINALVLVVILFLMDKIQIPYEILKLIIKVAVAIFISLAYVQLTGQFNVINIVKSKLHKK